MSIRKRGNKWQVDVIGALNGAKVRHRESCDTEQEATIREKEIELAFARGDDPRASRPEDGGARAATSKTIREVFDETYRRFWEGTPQARNSDINWKDIERFFGASVPFNTLNLESIDRFVQFLTEKGNSHGTINRKLATLSKMSGFAAERGWVSAKIRVGFRKERQGRIRFFSATERTAILRYYTERGEQEWHDYFLMLIDTAARASEVETLQGRDFHDGAIHIWHTKADLPRTIPLTERAKQAIQRRMLSDATRPFGYATEGARRHAWDRMKVSLGLEGDEQFVPHACRHDCATRLLRATGNILLVQRWLGHRTLEMTLRYAHLVTSDLERGCALLEGLT